VIFLSNQKLSTKPAHLHLSFGTFSYQIYVHFIFHLLQSFYISESPAYEIFYARKVDLFDKMKEVVFPQLCPCVFHYNVESKTNHHNKDTLLMYLAHSIGI
jgi:hypothetical protein